METYAIVEKANNLIAPYKHITVSFIYCIEITDVDRGETHRYIGQARNYKRLVEYRNNMRRICQRLPKRTTPGQEPYRAIHFALYHGIKHGWDTSFHVLELCQGRDKTYVKYTGGTVYTEVEA